MLHIRDNGLKFLLRRKYNGDVLKALWYSSLKSLSTSTIAIEENDKTFEEITNKRRSEAKRSIVVQVNSENSFTELYKYCSKFGEILSAHHYKIPHENFHYILIEYEKEDELNTAIDSSCYNDEICGIPARSPFLWFRTGKNKGDNLKQNKKQNVNLHEYVKLLKTINGTSDISENDLKDLLQCCESLEDQIKSLYKSTCLNDLDVRLRFMAARQIETSISGIFPRANAQPFGSSVNGFGKMRSDLDLILRLDEENRMKLDESRLVFHTKENLTNGRSQTQRQMESIGDILQLFLPGICSVRRILQARVPIIKFHHEHLDLEIDLSMSNLSGVYMSELFHMFGQIDSRVRPLTFCLKRWAQSVGLTNPIPGRWITNFSLTCLVIFFLQQLKKPILPSINMLTKLATFNDKRITEDGINCTFLRNCKNLKFTKNNETPINELLLQFFEYYSQFDFNNRAISLNEGRTILKPDHSAVYIVNPLEQILNVSKNISFEECERFRIEVRNAAWILETEIENNSKMNKKQILRGQSWGLLNLFRTIDKTTQTTIHANMFFKPRMVEVSDLFNEKEVKQENHKNLFKNSQIRNEITNVKNKTNSDLKQMRMNSSLSGSTKSKR